MFYLAKGLHMPIGELLGLEFVEFMYWLDMEVRYNEEVDRRMKEATQKK